MNSITSKIIFRFALLMLLQVAVFKQFTPSWGYGVYFHTLIYPIFIIILPFRLSKINVILLGFLFGIILDMFYSSPGVHASACVFTAFIRPTVLAMVKPQAEYDILHSPTISQYGFVWFAAYSAIMLFVHLLFYFSVEAFTFVYIGQILLKTFASFIVSYFLIILFQFITNPK